MSPSIDDYGGELVNLQLGISKFFVGVGYTASPSMGIVECIAAYSFVLYRLERAFVCAIHEPESRPRERIRSSDSGYDHGVIFPLADSKRVAIRRLNPWR